MIEAVLESLGANLAEHGRVDEVGAAENVEAHGAQEHGVEESDDGVSVTLLWRAVIPVLNVGAVTLDAIVSSYIEELTCPVQLWPLLAVENDDGLGSNFRVLSSHQVFTEHFHLLRGAKILSL